MDFNRDGEVSFDEFVRWYSMSTALQQTEQQKQKYQQHQQQPPLTLAPIGRGGHESLVSEKTATTTEAGVSTPAAAVTTTSPSTESTLARAGTASTAADPGSSAGAFRLLADLEGLTLADALPSRAGAARGEGSSASSTSLPAVSMPPSSSSQRRNGNNRVPSRETQVVNAASCSTIGVSYTGGGGGGGGAMDSSAPDGARKGNDDGPVVLAPTSGDGVWAVDGGAAGGRRAATEEEKNAFRERWLAGGVVAGDGAMVLETSVGCGGGGTEGPAVAAVETAAAAQDLERALEMLCVLVKGNADADTLIAALASCMIRNPTGRWVTANMLCGTTFLSHTCTEPSHWLHAVLPIQPPHACRGRPVGVLERDNLRTRAVYIIRVCYIRYFVYVAYKRGMIRVSVDAGMVVR